MLEEAVAVLDKDFARSLYTNACARRMFGEVIPGYVLDLAKRFVATSRPQGHLPTAIHFEHDNREFSLRVFESSEPQLEVLLIKEE